MTKKLPRNLKKYKRKLRHEGKLKAQHFAEFIKQAKEEKFFTRLRFSWHILIGMNLRYKIQKAKGWRKFKRKPKISGNMKHGVLMYYFPTNRTTKFPELSEKDKKDMNEIII